jgi:HAE1 family hydrophobic/amphiphilic exporter-1
MRSRARLTPVGAFLVLALPRLAAAQAAAVQTSGAAPSAGLPLRVGVIGQRDLSLPEALSEALANNPDIAVARTTVEQAGYGISGALGAFEPQFGLQSSLVRQVTPIASIIGGSASGAVTSNDLLVGPRVSGLSPRFGTNYQASLTARRQTTDNSFVQLNPQYPSALALSFTQPLFRGRKIDQARRQVEVARRNQELTEAQFRQRVMDVTVQVEQAYWDLAFARENLGILTAGLELATRVVEANRRLVDQGVSAPIDIVEAESQRTTLRSNLFGAQNALTRAENALKVLLAPDTAAGIWSSALAPVTAPKVPAADPVLDAAVKAALGSRPELQQLAVSSSVNRANTDFFKDQTKPQVDLVGTYTSSGLAGRTFVSDTGNPLTSSFAPVFDRLNTLSKLQGLPPIVIDGGDQQLPARLVGGPAQSFTNLLRQDFPTVEVGVRIAVPFRNQTAEANLASAVVEGKRIELQRRQVENAVAADVRNAMQAVASARATLETATEATRLAEQQYASEQRKFDAGTSTVFLVLQRQSALINTRSFRARAEADLSKSLAQLNRATGRILDEHQIAVTAK